MRRDVPWKSGMLDPGEPSSYFPQTFPGHPLDYALQLYEAGPRGTPLVGGVSAGLPMLLAGYHLETDYIPAWRSLYIKNLATQSPQEARRALREIFQKAKIEGADSITFSPIDMNFNPGAKRSMAKMAVLKGAKPFTREPGYNIWELPLYKLEELLGIRKR